MEYAWGRQRAGWEIRDRCLPVREDTDVAARNSGPCSCASRDCGCSEDGEKFCGSEMAIQPASATADCCARVVNCRRRDNYGPAEWNAYGVLGDTTCVSDGSTCLHYARSRQCYCCCNAETARRNAPNT